MAGSVIVVSADAKLYERIQAALLPDGRFVDTGDGLHCDGSAAPLTNIYPVEPAPSDWEGWDARTGEIPDPRVMSHAILECRSPSWIAEIGKILSEGLDSPVWFIDAADVPWPAGAVDPDRLALS